MSTSLEKRIFLVISPDESRCKRTDEIIKKHVSAPTVYTAADGTSALAKIKNVPPHVVITDYDLPKMSGAQMADMILKDEALKNVAIVFAAPHPKDEKYIDQLVTGQVQFMEKDEEEEFAHCLVKALNFASNGDEGEFHLHYLAKGDLLIKEGEKGEVVYIVKKGSLRAFRMIEGRDVTLGNISVGEFVGEMAFINGEPRSANVEALSESELIEIPIGTLEKVLYSRPSWSKTLMLTLSRRLKQANVKKN